ncbi:MAG: rhodanese-like domain-containing protein [Spirochaetaceae bacterium]
MKNALLILMVALVTLFIGCGAEEAEAPAQTDTQAEETTESAAPEFSVSEFVREYVADLADSNNIVSMDDFVAMAQEGEEMYVVDIRRAEDYKAGHVDGAVNAPWGTSAIWEVIPHLPTDETVYAYCYSGQTCGQATVMMRMAGIDAVSVNSGWNLGISRVDGYESVVSTDATEIDTSYDNGVSDEVLSTIQTYYEELAEAAGTPFANHMVSEEDAKAILDAEDESVQFVSMRRPDDYAEGHIETAVNYPFGPTMYDEMGMLPTDKKLIVYCYSGQTANQGVALLRLLGYDAVSLLYGMGTPRTDPRGWINNDFPVVSS